MDSISEFFRFFINKDNKPHHKVITVFIVLLGLFFLDNTLNFSSNYNNIRKLDQIEKIGVIISDTSLSNNEISSLKNLRKSILTHKTLKEKTYNFITNFEFKTGINENKTEIRFTVYNWHFWLHFITAGLPFILVGLIKFVMDISVKNDIVYSFFRALFSLFQILVLAFIWSKLLSLIPILSNPHYNYLINVGINIVIIFITYKAVRFLEKKEAYVKFNKKEI